jgi:phytoene dehydrogenase-like protein
MTARRGSYDAVIVGGGHNGLVAAAYLARAGRSCLLLERRSSLGGAAVSEEIFAGVPARLSRYSYLVSLLPELIVRELELGVRLLPRRISSYTPDPRADGKRGLLVDDGDPIGTRRSFREITGGEHDHAAWERFYAMTRRVAQAVFPTLTEPLRSRAQLRALVGDDRAWEAIFERPLGEVLAETFDDDLVAGVALTDGLIGTFARAGGEDLLQNRCFLYHVIGRGSGEWQVPLGGMGRIVEELARAARAAGAELLTDSEVLAIEPSGSGSGAEAGAGVGVRFRDGDSERAVGARRVLVNAAPRELERLLGRPPTGEQPPEGAQVKLNMLLRRLPRLKDPAVEPERAFAGTFHANELASQLDVAHAQAATGALPAPIPCEAYCHSLTDSSILGRELRAAGVHTLTVFALHTPARIFAGDPGGAHEAALHGILRSLNSVLAEPIEDCLLRSPEGGPCLEIRTPLDLQQELRMPGGHIFHRDLSWPFASSEEEVGGWGVGTDERAVLLCGAGARRGGGVSGIPGRNAAMAAIAELPPG